MFKRLFLLALSTAPLTSWAQSQIQVANPVYGYWEDVIQFSDMYGSATSRMNAIQNASVGLGGDVSNAASNPAGLGLMKRSEITFSPGLIVTTTNNSQYNPNLYGAGQGGNSDVSGSGSNFHIGQMGIAFSNKRSDVEGGAFRGGTFAINLSRTNHFNNYRTFNSGVLTNGTPIDAQDTRRVANSYIDRYLGYAYDNAVDPNGFPARDIINTPINQNGDLFEREYELRYAYNQYLVDTNVNGAWTSSIPQGKTRQTGRIWDAGSQNQIDFAYGANFNDKLFVGGGIGVPYMNSQRQVLYDEVLVETANQDAGSLQYQGMGFTRRETYTWSGIGFNAKFGMIYKLDPSFRVGLSFQSPSWYSVTNDYHFSVDARFVNSAGRPINYIAPTGDTLGQPTLANTQDVYRIDRTRYSMRTPGNVAAGASYFFGRKGFLSLQATYLPYSWARLGGNAYSGDNDVLHERTRNPIQLRAGGEAVLTSFLLARVGVAWYQNPVKDARDMWSYSAGLGLSYQNWALDLSANIFQRRQSYTVFSSAQVNDQGQLITNNAGQVVNYQSPTISSIANNVLTQVTLSTKF